MAFAKHVALSASLTCLLVWLAEVPALAQGRGASLTLRFTAYSPLLALIAGILILIFPRLLNYIVAIYLILIGLIGLFGR
jgi:hypothetical protein